MMKKICYLFLLSCLVVNTLHAQDRNSQTMENLEYLKQLDPQLELRMQEIERHTQMVSAQLALRSSEDIITIPVVVHVLYNTSAENVTTEIINSQMDVLNDDFRRLNVDQTDKWPQAADVKIEFQLAQFDPQGNTTNGINRVRTSKNYFHPDNSMKYTNLGGANAWPSDKYLNIWVCDLKGGKMGYAQFPGGPKATDGIVVDYAFFGKNNYSRKYGLGRTATHEVGHWLNLRHIWGDGDCNRDDYVNDTPSASYPSFGCQEGKISCGSEDMVANFMDYSYDACMNLFTKGQKVRMRALFEPGGAREGILHSHALGQNHDPITDIVYGNDDEAEDIAIETGCATPSNTTVNVEGKYLKANWESEASKFLFEIKLSANSKWFGFEVRNTDVSIAGIQSGWQYEIRVTALCEDGSKSDPFTFKYDTGNGRYGESAAGLLTYGNPVSNQLSVEWIEGHSEDYTTLSPDQHPPLQLVESTTLSQYDTRSFVQRLKKKKKDTEIARIQLFDMNGRLVLDEKVPPGSFQKELFVKHLQSGIYVMAQFSKRGRLIGSQKIGVTNIR